MTNSDVISARTEEIVDQTVLCGTNVFLNGSDTVKDDQRSGRSISSRTPEIMEKVRNFVADNRYAPLRMMADSFNINKEAIRIILHEDLGKAKVCAKFIPHTLSPEQKAMRSAHCRDIISAAENDKHLEVHCYRSFDVKDAPRAGRPVVENVDKITEIIEVDRHVSSPGIAQELKIDHQTVLSHLRKVGFKKKLHVWVPHQLAPKNMMD
ncbi:FLJ37770-like protein [Trichonephila clavipes]|nr:FLJ37770-like protein [Trichonephila clavipes]